MQDLQPCVIGLGACTPVGRSWISSAAAVRAGMARLAAHPRHVDPRGRTITVAAVGWLEPTHTGADRLASLAAPAAREALLGVPQGPVHLWLSVAAPRPGRPRTLETTLTGHLLAALHDTGHSLVSLELVADDHAAGIDALARASEALRTGACEVAVVGGVDSQLEGDTLDWLAEQRRLHTADNPRGSVPGEAAGFVVLTTAELAARHGSPVLARLAAAAVAREDRLGRDDINTGAGLSAAIAASLTALPDEARIDRRYCDCTGEPGRIDELAFATVRISDRLVDPGSFSAPAGCWGDVGAATAPLLLALAAAAAHRGYASGPHALLTTSSPQGLRGAALIRADVRAPAWSR